MKKVLLIALLAIGVINAQSFKSDNILFKFSHNAITIGNDIWAIDSTQEVGVGANRVVTCYLHNGSQHNVLTAYSDGIKMSGVKMSGIWEPTYLNATSNMCYKMVEWQDTFPPYDYHDTIIYTHPHKIIK